MGITIFNSTGSFLYNSTRRHRIPDTPKGSPVPIETVDVNLIELSSLVREHHPMAMALQKLPRFYMCLFRFETPQDIARYHESRTSHRMVKQSP
jgi:hypothetical protein